MNASYEIKDKLSFVQWLIFFELIDQYRLATEALMKSSNWSCSSDMPLPTRNTAKTTHLITTIFDNRPRHGNAKKKHPLSKYLTVDYASFGLPFAQKTCPTHIYLCWYSKKSKHALGASRCVKSAIIHKSWSRRPTAVSSEQTRVLIVFAFCLECHEGESPLRYPRKHLDSSGFVDLVHICTQVHSALDPIIRLSDIGRNIIFEYSVGCVFDLP